MSHPQTRIWATIGFIALALFFIVLAFHKTGRHKREARIVKTKAHRIYVENNDGSSFEFFPDGGEDVSLPTSGNSSFRLPKGSWIKAEKPDEKEIEEEEETQVEESDAGQPEADASGDVGSDSDGSSSSDSGGDSGGGGDGD